MKKLVIKISILIGLILVTLTCSVLGVTIYNKSNVNVITMKLTKNVGKDIVNVTNNVKTANNKSVNMTTINVLTDVDEINDYDADVITKLTENLYQLGYKNTTDASSAFEQMKKDTNVKNCEMNSKLILGTLSATENLSEELPSSSTESGVKENAAIKSDSDKIVAIIDTGVDTSNTSLQGRLLDGISIIDNTISDVNGHGTNIAVLIAKNTSERVKILPIKAVAADGSSSVCNIYTAIIYAINNNADVINISMSGKGNSSLLESAIDYAYEKGIPVVVSAGNNSANANDFMPGNINKAITVSAVSNDKKLYSYSNYGSSIDFVSYGTDYSSGEQETGTSIASAYVSSYVVNNPDITYEQMVSNAEDLGDTGRDDYYGNGLIEFQSLNRCTIGDDSNIELMENKNNTEETAEETTYLKVSALNSTTGHFYISSEFEGDSHGNVVTRFDISAPSLSSAASYKPKIKLYTGTEDTKVTYKKVNGKKKMANYYNVSVTTGSSTMDGFEKKDPRGDQERYFIIPLKIKCDYKSGVGMHVTDDDTRRKDYPSENKYKLSETNGSTSGFTFEILSNIAKDAVGGTKQVSGIDTNCIGLTNQSADGKFHYTTFGFRFDNNKVNFAYDVGAGKQDSNTYTLDSSGYALKSGKKWFSSSEYGTKDDLCNASNLGFYKTGYSFAGWKNKADSKVFNQTTKYAATEFKESDKSTVETKDGVKIYLEAQWTPNTYTLTFNPNTGNTPTPASKTSTYKDAWGTLATVTKTGYTFKGWYTAKSGGTQVTTETICSGDATAYAHWTPLTYNVRYLANVPATASTSISKNGQVESESYAYDTVHNLADVVWTLPGYSNVASSTWNSNATATGVYYADKASVKNLSTTAGSTVNFYMHWIPNNYTVSFDPNLPNGWSEPLSGAMSSIHAVFDTPLALPANTYSTVGMTFKSWNTKADGTGITYLDKASVTSLTTSGIITLYAQWKPTPYKVIYKSGDYAYGSDVTETWEFSVKHNLFNNTPNLEATKVLGTTPHFYKSGYYIDYWSVSSITGNRYAKRDKNADLYTETEYTSAYVSSSSIVPALDLVTPKDETCAVIFKAHWKPLQYRVEYNNDTTKAGSSTGYDFSTNTNTTVPYDYGKTFDVLSLSCNRSNKFGKSLFLGFGMSNGDTTKNPVYYVQNVSPTTYNSRKTLLSATDFAGKVTTAGVGYTSYFKYMQDGAIQTFPLYAVWDDCPGVVPVDINWTSEGDTTSVKTRLSTADNRVKSNTRLEYDLLMYADNRATVWDREDNQTWFLSDLKDHYFLSKLNTTAVAEQTEVTAFEIKYTVVDSSGNKYTASGRLYSGLLSDILVDGGTINR